MKVSYLSPKTRVGNSTIQGRGLFASSDLQKGEVVAVKGGCIFDHETLKKIQPILGASEIQIGEGLYIGPLTQEDREGSMIFSNHCCEPNIGVQGNVVFVAMRDIAAGEELTHDWAMTDDDESSMTCNCGAKTCRGTITGKDWQRPDLQSQYGPYFSSYLQQKIKSR
jgi:uncharacterized protein